MSNILQQYATINIIEVYINIFMDFCIKFIIDFIFLGLVKLFTFLVYKEYGLCDNLGSEVKKRRFSCLLI